MRSDTGPFSIVPEWVLDAVGAREVQLYTLLGRYADAEGDSFPSRTTLAKRMGCSTDTVDRAVKELVSVGALSVEHRTAESGDPTTNRWTVHRVRPVENVPLWGSRMDAGSRTDAARGSRTSAAQNENHLHGTKEDLALPREKSTSRTKRDEIFDALVDAFGPASTRTRASMYGKVVSELVVVDGVNGDEVRRRAGVMLAKDWENSTPVALAKHWDTLDAEPAKMPKGFDLTLKNAKLLAEREAAALEGGTDGIF